MTSTLEVRRLAKFVGKVRRSRSVLTLVDKENKFKINSLSCHQPVQLTDVVVQRR